MSGPVLIVGMGGLGCPAAVALVRAGVTQLTLVDPDRVELSNLHRQLLYTDADVALGRPKVLAAAAALRRLTPVLRVESLEATLDARNGPALFALHALVLDCVDGAAAKFVLSDMAVTCGVPLVHAGAIRME